MLFYEEKRLCSGYGCNFLPTKRNCTKRRVLLAQEVYRDQHSQFAHWLLKQASQYDLLSKASVPSLGSHIVYVWCVGKLYPFLALFRFEIACCHPWMRRSSLLALLLCLSQSLALFLESIGIQRAATPGMVQKVLCCSSIEEILSLLFGPSIRLWIQNSTFKSCTEHGFCLVTCCFDDITN